MKHFEEEVKSCFDFLFEKHGFVFSGELSETEYRNLVVIAQTKEIRMRFIKDRSDFFLDVGSPAEPEKWYDFYKILLWLKERKLISENFKPSNRMNTVRNLLKKHFDLINANFRIIKNEFG
jgi:hypothetical protein